MTFRIKLSPAVDVGAYFIADLTVEGIGDDPGPATGTLLYDYVYDRSINCNCSHPPLWLAGSHRVSDVKPDVTRLIFNPNHNPEEMRQRIFDRLVFFMERETAKQNRRFPRRYRAEEITFQGRRNRGL